MARSRAYRIVTSVLGIALSRGIGLVFALAVSVLLAHRLGAGAQTDAFFFARRITAGLAEAAYRVAGIALIPSLVAALQTETPGTVTRLYRGHLARVLVWAIPAGLLLSLSAPWVVRFLGPGLSGERAELAVRVLHVLFFLIPTSLFLAISTSLLNAGRIFGFPAAMSQLSRFLVVLALLFFVPPHSVGFLARVMLAGSFTAGVVLFGVTNWSLPRICSTDLAAKRKVGVGASDLLWPGLIFFGVGQFAVWVDFGFASTLGTGRLSMLEYGYRFMGILPGLLSASLNTVLYTEFAHQSATGNLADLQRSLIRSARAGLFIIAPVVGFIAFQGHEIISLFLRHGEFAEEAVQTSARVMLLAGPGMALAFVARVMVFGMYTDRTAPRLKITVVTMSLALASRFLFVWIFSRIYGVAGVALGSSLGSIVMVLVVMIALKRTWPGFLKFNDLRAFAMVLVITTASMAAAHYLGVMAGWTTSTGLVARVMGLAGQAVIGGGLFLVLAALLKMPELRAAGSFLRRKPAA